jgi:hypothetical protein
MIRLFAVPVLLQIVCLIHLIRNKGDRSWIYLIVFIPIAGSIAYIIMEIILPFLKSSKAQDISGSIIGSVNKDNKIKKLQEQFIFSPTFKNELALADAHSEYEQYDMAIESYQSCLKGAYGDEPAVKLKLANALYKNKNYIEAKNILEELKISGYKPDVVWMAYIQVLEKLNELDNAVAEFKEYIVSYSNLESRCRYALFLKKHGFVEESKHEFNRLISDSYLLPKFKIREQKDWIRLAKNELKNFEG